jgi:hypothetical protein
MKDVLNLPTNVSVKSAYKFLSIITILFIITMIILNSDVLDVYLENEYFTNLRKYFLYNNLKNCNNKCQSKILNLQHSLGRKNNIGSTRHPDTNYNINNDIPTQLMYLDAKALGYINRLVQIKQGSMCLIPSENNDGLEFRNIKLDTRGYESSCFKVALGLVDPTCISLYHMASDRFVCRKPDGTLFLANFDMVKCDSRQAFSFKLCQSMANRDSIIISCPRMNSEQETRVWSVSKDVFGIKNIPKMNKFSDITDLKTFNYDFKFIDCHSGIVLGTKYEGLDIKELNNTIDRETQRNGIPADEQLPFGLHLPKFFNNGIREYATTKEGFTSGIQMRKSKVRDTVANMVKHGLVGNNEINRSEIFGSNDNNNDNDSVNSLLTNYSSHTHRQREAFVNGDSDAKDANDENNVPTKLKSNAVFDTIKGKDAEKLLTNNMAAKNYANILSDSLMERLQKAKLDPDVQNLLDYNDALYRVYKEENDAFDAKLNEQKEQHLKIVDDNIRIANNHRVSQMARDLFNMESILKEKKMANK